MQSALQRNPALIPLEIRELCPFSSIFAGEPDCGERTTVTLARASPAFFSAPTIGSPTLTNSLSEGLAIGNRTKRELDLTFVGPPFDRLRVDNPQARAPAGDQEMALHKLPIPILSGW